MKNNIWLLLATGTLLAQNIPIAASQAINDPVAECRFAKDFSKYDLLATSESRQEFLTKVYEAESRFVREIAVDPTSGLTLDGWQLDVLTGETLKPHLFTAASKESIHLALLGLVLDGHKDAFAFYSESEALEMLKLKANTYEEFDSRYPGYGGFLPWIALNPDGTVTPAWDWLTRVPALDNGELFWAIYGVVEVLESKYSQEKDLIRQWTDALNRMTRNAVKMFYHGEGKVRSVTVIENISLSVENNTYTIEAHLDCTSFDNPCFLDDPYEGEMFTVMMHLFSSFPNEEEKEKIWI